MAVGAEKNALREFDADIGFGPVRKRAKIEIEALRTGVKVMPGQCSDIAAISAAAAASPRFADQLQLASRATGLLGTVALMAVIGVRVLA